MFEIKIHNPENPTELLVHAFAHTLAITTNIVNKAIIEYNFEVDTYKTFTLKKINQQVHKRFADMPVVQERAKWLHITKLTELYIYQKDPLASRVSSISLSDEEDGD